MSGENGPVVLVTGATDGIGRETALELARRGARVIVHGRSRERAAETCEALRAVRPDAALEPLLLDLSRLDDVRGAAAVLDGRGVKIDVLLNNAGIYMREHVLSPDGFEMTFAVNHLAPFALTHALLASPAGERMRRIVNVSSIAHTRGSLVLDDLSFVRRKFDHYAAYAASKLANVLFTVELARRLQGRGVTANSLHPGVVSTKLLTEGFRMSGRDSVAAGAATSVRLALDADVAGVTGGYFSDGKPAAVSAAGRDGALARRFYEQSAVMAGVTPLPLAQPSSRPTGAPRGEVCAAVRSWSGEEPGRAPVAAPGFCLGFVFASVSLFARGLAAGYLRQLTGGTMSTEDETKTTDPRPLAVGDSMPSLDGVVWIKGAAPKTGGNPTIVEFWATWCPPCIASIPHLTGIQHRHRGKLSVVGLTDEDADTAQPFVEERGDDMDYAVGIASEATYKSYMEGIDGIPSAFLFDATGRLVWKGHPMAIDSVVDGLIDGSLTSEKLLEIGALHETFARIEEELNAREGEEWREAINRRLELTRKMLALDPRNVDVLCKHLDSTIYSGADDEFHDTIKNIRIEDLSGSDCATLADSLHRNRAGYRALTLCMRLLDRSLSLQPGDRSVLYLASQLYTLIGDFRGAIKALKGAMEDDDEMLGAELQELEERLQLSLRRPSAAKAARAAKATRKPAKAARAAGPTRARKSVRRAKPARATRAAKGTKATKATKAKGTKAKTVKGTKTKTARGTKTRGKKARGKKAS